MNGSIIKVPKNPLFKFYIYCSSIFTDSNFFQVETAVIITEVLYGQVPDVP